MIVVHLFCKNLSFRCLVVFVVFSCHFDDQAEIRNSTNIGQRYGNRSTVQVPSKFALARYLYSSFYGTARYP
jgi:hypothetical protein